MNIAEQKSIEKIWIVLQEIQEKRQLLQDNSSIIDFPKEPSGFYLKAILLIEGGEMRRSAIIQTRIEVIKGLAKSGVIKIVNIDGIILGNIKLTITKKFDSFYKEIEKKYNTYREVDEVKTEIKPLPKETEIRRNLISRDKNGDYFYSGRRIEMNHETLYYQLFDILFLYCDQGGFISYENIERELIKKESPESETETSRNKRVNNAIFNKQQGLFRFAKVNGKRLQNKIPDGRKLIELIRGKGLKINNPIA